MTNYRRMDEFLLAPLQHRPEAVAVVDIDAAGTSAPRSYAALAALVDRCVDTLAGVRLGVGDRVVVSGHTCAASVAALLACSRLGLIYVPVGHEIPDIRARAVADVAEPRFWLDVTSAPPSRAPRIAPDGCGIGSISWDSGIVVERPPRAAGATRETVSSTDPAYIIFTSGTTGGPKGVVMSHRSVLAFYQGMLDERIAGHTDVVASTSAIQFDFSLLDLGMALGSGAALVPVPRVLLSWPRRFLSVLRDNGVTHVNGVPSIWRSVLRHERTRLAELTGLRCVLFCGEEFPLPELTALQDALPHARLVNCYGATESMACSFADVPNPLPADAGHLSIGTAHRDAEMVLINRRGEVVTGVGEVGEIYLRSPALFSGYWDDPAATADALVPDPIEPRTGQKVLRSGDLAYRDATGALHFCGRRDSQVQIRGNRVELAEIEHQLAGAEGVTAAGVVVWPPTAEESKLVAFVAASPRYVDDPRTLVTRLRELCIQTLPRYMVPHDFHVREELPANENGKLDRGALARFVAELEPAADDQMPGPWSISTSRPGQ